MFHVQKVYRFHIKAVLSEIRRKTFKKLTLGIRDERGLTAFCAAHEERDNKASGLAAARRADAEQIVVVSCNHLMCGIERISVRVVRMLFDFAEDHTLCLARGR